MMTVGMAVERGQLEAKQQYAFDPQHLPPVQFVPCAWFGSGLDRQHNVETWIAGQTFFDKGFVRVSTQEPERTLSLVRWETINFYLMAIGRDDLTDVWAGFSESGH